MLRLCGISHQNEAAVTCPDFLFCFNCLSHCFAYCIWSAIPDTFRCYDKCRDKEKVTLSDGHYKHPLNNVFKSIQIYLKNVDFLTLFSSLYIKVAK